MLMNDSWITEACVIVDEEGNMKPKQEAMIEPFLCETVEKGKISYGLSSYGYDIRLSEDVRVFSNLDGKHVDVKRFDKTLLVQAQVFHERLSNESYVLLPPNGYCLGRTVEYFKVPRGILGICVGKSTYARGGVIVNTTPLEPEWEGYLTLEICNGSSNYVKLYVNEGIAQVMFLVGGYLDAFDGVYTEACRVSYKDKKGKYQKQEELTLAKIK